MKIKRKNTGYKIAITILTIIVLILGVRSYGQAELTLLFILSPFILALSVFIASGIVIGYIALKDTVNLINSIVRSGREKNI